MRLPRLRNDYGSVLLGSTDDSPRTSRVRIQLVLTTGVLIANAIGVALAIALATVGIPRPAMRWDPWWMPFLVMPIYIGIAFLLGVVLGTVRLVRSLRWSIRGETPTAQEARAAMTAPWRLTVIQALLWAGGTIVVTVGYGIVAPELMPKVSLITGLSGVVVCAISYLITRLYAPRAASAASTSTSSTKVVSPTVNVRVPATTNPDLA